MIMMKQLSSGDFRKQYHSQAEPVEVTAWGKVIGTWIPAGSSVPDGYNANEGEVSESEDEPRMTIRPPRGPKRELVSTARRVIDPVEAARRERERYAQLASRMYGSKRSPERR